jgi:hypothetical protein
VISRELGHKSEAPQVFAKLQIKKNSIMILGELKDKSEAQQAFARMFTSLLHDLVTNAKMQRINS